MGLQHVFDVWRLALGGQGGTTTGCVIFATSGTLSWAYPNGQTASYGSTIVSYTPASITGRWLRVLVTSDSATYKTMFVNGVQVATVSATLATFTGAIYPAIGSINYSATAGEALDDFKLWGRTFSAREALEEYNQSLAGYPDLLNRVRPRTQLPTQYFRRTLFDRAGSRGAA